MQATLVPRAGVFAPNVRPRRPAILARSEGPRVNQGRTFREEDGSMVGSDGKPSSNEPLYADQVQQPKRKDNMSKEMKAKLRQEYIGLGGSENKGIPMHLRRLPIVAAVSIEEQTLTQQAPATTPPAVNSTGTVPVGSSKWVIDPNENLKSTAEHRFWTFSTMAVLGATFAEGLSGIHSPSDIVSAAGSFFAAYLLSDLGTGIYHWGVDNYGGPDTPVFGRQIAAFQGHHHRPWTITEREFCNNVHQVFKPAIVPAAFFLALSPLSSPAWDVFISSFVFLVCMSQQFHAWSHMKKSELPGLVVALQDANLLIGRKMHGAHHRPPFNDNYSIVSGWTNPILDASGIFKITEDFIYSKTGIESRAWYEPNEEWAEIERPSAS